MKPDEVSTASSEPMEAEGAQAVAQPAGSEEIPPQASADASSEKTNPTAAKKAPGKTAKAESKPKDTLDNKNTRPGWSGLGARPKTQSGNMNGLTKSTATTKTKKPVSFSAAALEKKRPVMSVAPTLSTDKTTTTTKVQSRATDRPTTEGASANPAISTRPTSAATRPTASSRRPVTATATATATATKPSTSLPKTNRSTSSLAPRPATTSATGRTTTNTATTTVARGRTTSNNTTAASTGRTTTNTTTTTTVARGRTTSISAAAAPTGRPAKTSTTSTLGRTERPAASNAATATVKVATNTAAARTSRAAQQTVKRPVTVAQKDVGKASSLTSTKKPLASTSFCPPANNVPEVPKVVSKRPQLASKAPPLKPDDKKMVATQTVRQGLQNGPRQVSTRSSESASSHRNAGINNNGAGKTQSRKPTQPVSSLAVNGKPNNKSAVTEALSTTSVATASASGLVSEVRAESSQNAPPIDIQEKADEPIPDSESVQDIPKAELRSVDVSPLSAVKQEDKDQGTEKAFEKVIAAVPVVMGENEKILATVSQSNNVLSSASSVVAEKNESIKSSEDVEEEEREGSQQVSLSEMSGTQPTEESRPGSAGLAGSVWRASALLSEFDSEEVSCSQQGASELSAPGVLEGTESMDDLGEASLKGVDGEGASVGSPDFEKVPDILTNEDEDDDDRVCDMDVGSEKAEDGTKQNQDGEYDEEDDDVEMASEGITESGLESYGNADEDDLTEDYRLENLNRVQPPPLVATAPLNQFSDFDALTQQGTNPTTAHIHDPTQTGHAKPNVSSAERTPSSPLPSNLDELPPCSSKAASLAAGVEGDVSLKDLMFSQESKAFSQDPKSPSKLNSSNGSEMEPARVSDIMKDLSIHLEHSDKEPGTNVLGQATGPTSALSSPSSATEDEASDTEGEMQITDPQADLPFTADATAAVIVAHSLSVIEEREELCPTEGGGSETPQSVTSAASYGFDYISSNAQSSAESSKSPGIFSLENEEHLSDKENPSILKELTLVSSSPPADKSLPLEGQTGDQNRQFQLEKQYMLCGEPNDSDSIVPNTKLGSESKVTAPVSPSNLEQDDPDTQHPYYSTISEKTDDSLAGRNSNFPSYANDLLSIQMAMSSKLRNRSRANHATQPLRLPTDLPPRIPSMGSNTQLRCLEQHQQQLQEIQQRQEKRSREQEKPDDDEVEKQAQDEDEKRQQEDSEKQRMSLELQLLQQEQELKQRQQMMQRQQEVEPKPQKHKAHSPVLLSPASGLCTIYESVEKSDSEDEDQERPTEKSKKTGKSFAESSDKDGQGSENKNPETQSQSTPEEHLKETIPESDEISPLERPLEFDWGKKVDIVQHLINQTLLLTGDGCSPLFLLPGGVGGTLSPLESSMWPNVIPPLTPPSATVTSVSSFSPEAPGSSAQGEWTVVELETHH